MKSILELTSEQLKKAAQIKEQIAALEQQLRNILGEKGSGTGASKGLSPAARAKISAAAKARWKKFRASNKSTTKAKSRKPMSAAQRAKIAAAQKARWAKAKEAGQ